MRKRTEEWLFLTIMSLGFLVMVVYFSKNLIGIQDMSSKEWAGLFITIAAGVQIYRTASALVRDYRSGGEERDTSSTSQLGRHAAAAVEALSNDPNPLRTAFKKRPWLFIAIFAFAFSLPVLFRLSTAGADGRRFNAEDWWFVIGGEIFVGVCLVIAWHRAKRLLKTQ